MATIQQHKLIYQPPKIVTLCLSTGCRTHTVVLADRSFGTLLNRPPCSDWHIDLLEKRTAGPYIQLRTVLLAPVSPNAVSAGLMETLKVVPFTVRMILFSTILHHCTLSAIFMTGNLMQTPACLPIHQCHVYCYISVNIKLEASPLGFHGVRWFQFPFSPYYLTHSCLYIEAMCIIEV